MTDRQATYPDLKDKRVIVTGAGQGIGLALTHAFHAAGCRVLAVVRSPVLWPESLLGDRLDILTCDIREPRALETWLRVAEIGGDHVDVLVNNAGQLRKGRLIDCSADDYDALFDVNTRATFFVAQMVARGMRAHGGGVIINTASYAATLASISHGVYAASKAAIVALTRSMAAEWAPFGIRVNAFSPGVIPTRMTEPALQNNQDRMLESISMRRLGATYEVADVALFLASSSSSYLTGINIDVTGGKLIVQDPGSAWT